MSNRIIKCLVFSLIALVATSCVITSPTPLVGAYSVLESDQSTSPYYVFKLNDDNTFIMIQSGGNSSSTAYIMKGSYSVDLQAFDFIEASGTITFNVKETNFDDDSAPELVFSTKVANSYSFYWYIPDRDRQDYRLEMKPISDVAKKLGNCFSISDDTFEKILTEQESK